MLSSVANRCYWTGRYLERAENTARLIDVYSALLLDLPRDSKVSWSQLISICGLNESFTASGLDVSERNVVNYMTADKKNTASILSSIRQARENLRTLRDVAPREAYELVNEFNISIDKRIRKATNSSTRYEVLRDIIERCQQLTGLFAGTMSHAAPYQFLRLGRNLERADMTSRILDIAGELLDESISQHEVTLWVNVLRSTSGYQAYRQSVQSRITPARVVYFLLADRKFPRSIAHCLNELKTAAATIPKGDQVLPEIERTETVLFDLSLRELVRESLHSELDNLQLRFGVINEVFTDTWFAPASALNAQQQKQR